MTDWKAANLAQRAARDAMDEQKRREAAAEQEAARADDEARETRSATTQAFRL